MEGFEPCCWGVEASYDCVGEDCLERVAAEAGEPMRRVWGAMVPV